MTPRLTEPDRGDLSEVKASHMGVGHRDADALRLAVLGEQLRWEPMVLRPKDEGVALLIAHVAVGLRGVRGKEPRALNVFKGDLPRGRHAVVDPRPIVEPRPLEVAVLNLKAQGLHKDELNVHRGAEPPNAASVLRDEGVDEDDLHSRVSL